MLSCNAFYNIKKERFRGVYAKTLSNGPYQRHYGERGGERVRFMCGSSTKIKNIYSQSRGKNITLECEKEKRLPRSSPGEYNVIVI